MINKIVVIDTNVLLDFPQIFENVGRAIICGTVVEEIDNIIHSERDEETKYCARRARNAIKSATNREYFMGHLNPSLFPDGWETTKNDNKIIVAAKFLGASLCTNDLIMQIKADSENVENFEFYGTEKGKEYYKGFHEITMMSTEYDLFLSFLDENKFELYLNQYLIIRDASSYDQDTKRCEEIFGVFKWTETGHKEILPVKFNSMIFGAIEPRDCYQMIAMDSLNTTMLTILTGVAGTAKTLMSLAYAFEKLRTKACSRLTIVFNSIPIKGTKDLGALPGTRDEKILGENLGEILSSKIGDIDAVYDLINDGSLHIIPLSHIRGYETRDSEILYVCEAQNMDIYTCKILLQRASEGCKIILDGDSRNQIDASNCSYEKNGMNRAIEVFKESDLFSCVELQEIYRSRICEWADKM